MILKLIPTGKEYLWGGDTLIRKFGKKSSGDTLAETWELSCHKDGPSSIAEGAWKGWTLSEYLKKFPEEAGSVPGEFPEFPVLIKLIDAKKNLSIQVHPDDVYAYNHEHQPGKTEMWYVVDAEPGAFLYYGFNRSVTKEEFAQAIEDETLCDLLQEVPVKKGDVLFIDSGTIHAIGAGIVIAEIQQSSDVTYRVFDYGRKDKDGNTRQLHISQALDVTSLHMPRVDYQFGSHLGRCRYFTTDLKKIDSKVSLSTNGTSFQSLLVLNGKIVVKSDSESCEAQKGDSLFIGANTGAYEIDGCGEALFTYVEPQMYRIGIDLGGTNIKAGVVDIDNRLIASAKRPTRAARSWQEIVADMAAVAKDALKKANLGIEDCISVGIGNPGIIDSVKGKIVFSNNISWENIPLAAEFRKYINLPVHITNDANCAVMGEMVAGAASGRKNVVLLTLGTGVGGGVILDGKVFEGAPGGAELGHATLIAGGRKCTCGRRGCIESYCSASALIHQANCALDEYPDSIMAEMKEKSGGMNGKIPFEAAQMGDRVAKIVVEQYIEWLGEAITNYINIFRPEIVLISGGVCGQGNSLTDPLNEFVKKYAFGGSTAEIPEVRIAALGNDAGIIGAANF